MKSLIKSEAGIIQALDDGHMMTIEDCSPGVFEKGNKIQAATMMQVWELHRDGSNVGFFFYSAFKTINLGGVLVTYLETKKGKAENASIVLRSPHLVIYDVVGCGSIAVSTKVNDRLLEILKEQ